MTHTKSRSCIFLARFPAAVLLFAIIAIASGPAAADVFE